MTRMQNHHVATKKEFEVIPTKHKRERYTKIKKQVKKLYFLVSGVNVAATSSVWSVIKFMMGKQKNCFSNQYLYI